MATVKEVKDRGMHPEFGLAGEWLYKFDLLKAEVYDNKPDDAEYAEYEGRYSHLEDEMFASAALVQEIDYCGFDRSFLIFKDGTSGT